MGDGEFVALPAKETGMTISGEGRDIISLNTREGKKMLVARNNDQILVFDIE
ncbi:MAG: hypothetical protein HC819_08750 [Cyclobacteriaceae bacterium]|nr:hypothetical protein [Cyclobacteriaceae bacterium]